MKYLSFGCVCLIIPVMAVATVLEKEYGSEFTREHIYTSLTVIIIWGVLSFSAVWYMLKVKLYKKVATFSLHLSLLLILIGALITHLSGHQGKIHLRNDGTFHNEYLDSNENKFSLPFQISLKEFNLEYYPGTVSPSDFISELLIRDVNKEIVGTVSMNKIYSFRNYRFYQSGYDADGKGSILSVSFDPYGIAVTYTGYLWLLLSIILFFFQKKSLFRKILERLELKSGFLIVFLIAGCAQAFSKPSTLPKDVAEKVGDLYIYYNGRITPLNTFATDFTNKIYGKDKFEGLTPEQIVAGWLFFYDEWKNIPFIKIKGKEVKDALGVKNNYARLTDFIGPSGFKLDVLMKNTGPGTQDVFTANEKFNLISTLVTGTALSIYPVKDNETGLLKWYSVKDKPSENIPFDQWLFIRSSMDLVAEKVALNDWEESKLILDKIKKYQIKEAGDLLLSETNFKIEKFYNKFNYDKPLAMIFLTVGILLFWLFLSRFASGKNVPRFILKGSIIFLGLLFIYLSMLLGFRWKISGHLPLSNGFETMQFLAWSGIIATVFISSFYNLVIPFGYLICGFTLLVAMIGESSPQITNLMPVLQSPLLSVHVMTVMLAYMLLFLIMFNGIAALCIGSSKTGNDVTQSFLKQNKIQFLQDISRLMLYPALFLLVIGIFIGAVWANVSWGRYWGWDPKEVWALITFLIYSIPLHSISLPCFRRPAFFHSYMVLAFLSVIVTYFGVNFFLGGLHSYA